MANLSQIHLRPHESVHFERLAPSRRGSLGKSGQVKEAFKPRASSKSFATKAKGSSQQPSTGIQFLRQVERGVLCYNREPSDFTLSDRV